MKSSDLVRENLNAHIKARGWSNHTPLIREGRLTNGTLGRIRKDAENIKLSTLDDLAEALGVRPVDLISQAAGAYMPPPPPPIVQTYRPVAPAPLPAPAPILSPPTARAHFTGQMQAAQSVTGAYGYNCEYSVNGQKFWRMFQGSCPSSVEVR